MFDWFRRRQSGRNDTRSGGSILWKPSVSQEVDADLSFHLDMLVREFQDSGMDREAAEARARARFGDYHQVSQACRAIAQGRERDRRRSDWHRGIRQDFLVAWRQIRRRPGLVVLALLMIALGVGATSGIFTVVNGVLLTPLPYPEPHRLVMVCEANEARASCGTMSPPNALDLAKASQTVSRIGLARSWTVAMEIEGKSQGIGGGLATPDFFQVMETAPALGRLFQPEDQAGVGSAVAIVSHLFWRTAFGGDSTIVGGSVAIDGVPTIIVGVLPEVGVKLVAFFDIGNAFLADDAFKPSELRYAAGWGVRWLSPFGPLRIEIGYPLEPEEDEDSPVILFSFGAPL